MTPLHVVPLDLSEGNAVVRAWHRHHQPVVGHRFTIGCVDQDGAIHGVCIVGRPVARLAGSPRDIAEVTRVATDGTPNACSILYGGAARAAKAMGFRRIQTYTLPEEGGASLRAAGWVNEGPTGGGDWNRKGRVSRTDQPMDVKTRWAKDLSARPLLTVTFPRLAVYGRGTCSRKSPGSVTRTV